MGSSVQGELSTLVVLIKSMTYMVRAGQKHEGYMADRRVLQEGHKQQ